MKIDLKPATDGLSADYPDHVVKIYLERNKIVNFIWLMVC